VYTSGEWNETGDEDFIHFLKWFETYKFHPFVNGDLDESFPGFLTIEQEVEIMLK